MFEHSCCCIIFCIVCSIWKFKRGFKILFENALKYWKRKKKRSFISLLCFQPRSVGSPPLACGPHVSGPTCQGFLLPPHAGVGFLSLLPPTESISEIFLLPYLERLRAIKPRVSRTTASNQSFRSISRAPEMPPRARSPISSPPSASPSRMPWYALPAGVFLSRGNALWREIAISGNGAAAECRRATVPARAPPPILPDSIWAIRFILLKSPCGFM
jgi:hypothetical protein